MAKKKDDYVFGNPEGVHVVGKDPASGKPIVKINGNNYNYDDAPAQQALYGGGQSQDAVAAPPPPQVDPVQAWMDQRPEYQGILNADGTFKAGFEFDPSQSNHYKLMSKYATQKGPTDYYKTQVGLINAQFGEAMNQYERDQQNAYASGVSNLAQSTGVDAGNMERLQRANMLQKAQGSANLYGGLNTNIAGAAAQDSVYKQGALNTVTGIDMGAQQFNIGNRIGDTYNANNYALEGWMKQGDVYGSKASADAMNDYGSGGGGFLSQLTGGFF